MFIKFIKFVILICCLANGILAVPSDAVLWQNFQTWANQYGKQYNSAEIQQRFQNWKTNTLNIIENNANNAKVDINIPTDEQQAESTVIYPEQAKQVYGVNQFSDLTYEEFAKTYTGAVPAASGGLSNVAIAGMVVGSVLLAASITAGTIFGYKKYKKLHTNRDNSRKDMEVGSPELNELPIGSITTSSSLSNSPPSEILQYNNQLMQSHNGDFQSPSTSPMTMSPPHGSIDIVNINTQRHQSITSRAVPFIKIDSKLIVVNTSDSDNNLLLN